MNESITAYPLCWPAGRPRTRTPGWSQFGTTEGRARDHMLNEIERLGGSKIIVSTNIRLRNDGYPYANQPRPDDPGVAVYFKRKDTQMCFACDKYNNVACNYRAIGKTIEALRGIERWGTGEMMERAFTGFEALPSPPQWWEILGYLRLEGLNEIDINDAYKRKAMQAHPDRGGSDTDMATLNWARDEGLKWVRENG